MRIEYEKEWNRSRLYIDLEIPFRADYQLEMLKRNKIPSLLEVNGMGLEDGSRYTYTVEGMQSMRQRHNRGKIDKEEILDFVSALISTAGNLRNYFLNPDCLLLDPECIFYRGHIYYFCYLPVRQKALYASFHEMTEYFVKNLDYDHPETVMLACELHKATLLETYDLEEIIKNYKEHEKDRILCREKPVEKRQPFPEESIFTTEEEFLEPTQDNREEEEPNLRKGPWKNLLGKVKKRRWGNWDDLILETDRQEKKIQL